MIYYLFVLLFCSIAYAQSDTYPPVNPTGFNSDDANLYHRDESWISKNEKYIIIAVVVVVVFAILTWYIVKSIRGMRKRLARENQANMIMMQGNGGGISETVPLDSHGFQKMSEYSVTPPQQQQPYTHRY
ncbi:hypothetical protein EDC94DRAFT_611054 [Helicostylum pulchrum]|uniref:Uncharacterized protein n=1 Tax=Helicostylum pulchrum TaxID=562976 RepID=A0ABP9Y9X4_9FUNG|nr:hypothetical protein EDC94DRAFT_611054 [Helicostylum pulchrum]